MSIVHVEVFDPETFAKVDGLKPSRTEFLAYLPAYLDGAVDVPAGGAPFLRVAPSPRGPGQTVHNLSAAIVNQVVARLQTHGPYAVCSDPAGYERRARGAGEWLAGLPPLPAGPMLRWKGRDVVTPIVCGVLERLIGSFSLAPAHAAEMVGRMAGAPTQSALEDLAARVARGGTWPADLDGARLDAEAAAVAEANRRSDEARARNAAEATRIVDVVVGDEGIEGFRARCGVLPPFSHLQRPGAFRVESRPPTHSEGGWQYWLRYVIPGEPLPSFTLGDGSGTVPRDTVLHMTKAQLAGVPGCWSDVFEVRALREGHGAIDRRVLSPEEMIGQGDERYEVVAESAQALIAQHLRSLMSDAGPQRLHVVSALVRGLLLRPDVASDLLWSAVSALAAPPAAYLAQPRPQVSNSWLPAEGDIVNTLMPTVSHTVEIAGTVGGAGRRIEDDAPQAVVPRGCMTREEMEAACLAAAGGDAFWSWHCPGVLLEPLRPTLLQRLASVVRQDPWQPVLAAALRERQDAKLRTEEVVAILPEAKIERTADTSRIKKVMGKLGWTKREFEVEGERFRAYAREVQP